MRLFDPRLPLLAVVLVSLVSACGSTSPACSTIPCAGSTTRSYELCSKVDGPVTYHVNGSVCSCSGYYTGGCTSCAQQAQDYCGVTPDLSVPVDLLPSDDALTPADLPDLAQPVEDFTSSEPDAL